MSPTKKPSKMKKLMNEFQQELGLKKPFPIKMLILTLLTLLILGSLAKANEYFSWELPSWIGTVSFFVIIAMAFITLISIFLKKYRD